MFIWKWRRCNAECFTCPFSFWHLLKGWARETETFSLTSFHSWTAGSLNSPQALLGLLASGAEESRAEKGVRYGWPKDQENPQHTQFRRGSREVLGTQDFAVPMLMCCQSFMSLQPSPSSRRVSKTPATFGCHFRRRCRHPRACAVALM